MIRSLEAPRGRASERRVSKIIAAWLTAEGTSTTCPVVAVSRYRISCAPPRSAMAKWARRPAWARRIFLDQDFLALHPGTDLFLNLLIGRVDLSSPQHGSGVVLGLDQTGTSSGSYQRSARASASASGQRWNHPG
jgi:hypothetical protein